MTAASSAPLRCPDCAQLLSPIDIPKAKLFVCRQCEQVAQVAADGSVIYLQSMLERNALGDDQVRAAINPPHVTTVKSFLEVLEQSERARSLVMAQATGALRAVMAQLENRIDSAISVFTGYDLVDDTAGAGLAALREARELASTVSSRSRGLLLNEGSGAES